MIFTEDGDHWLAGEDETFEGWEILAREPFKDGVDRVHIRNIPAREFRMVYQRVRTGRSLPGAKNLEEQSCQS